MVCCGALAVQNDHCALKRDRISMRINSPRSSKVHFHLRLVRTLSRIPQIAMHAVQYSPQPSI